MTITLKPETSTILIVEPSRLHSRLLGTAAAATTATKFRYLDEAANHAGVTRWFAVFDQNDQDTWLCEPCSKRRNRVFSCDETKMPWHNRELVDAIKSEDRSRLLMCGFWLDKGLGASALEALVEGLDVHVITDLTFARDKANRQSGFRRLDQLGVVPVTLSEVLFEFMSWAADEAAGASIRQLLGDPVFQDSGASA